jgi:predicted ATP-dependent endonuclease of OLD family
MKVKSLELKGYKQFKNKKIDFFDAHTGLAKNIIVLVGENGSGKSSVLQAIASVLGTATGMLKQPSELDWAGFIYASMKRPNENLLIKLTVQFEEEELKATTEFAKQLGYSNIGNDLETSLTIDFNKNKVLGKNYNQFKGRNYAITIRKQNPDTWDNFLRVGSILWYTEQRTATSLNKETAEDSPIVFNYDTLRRRLYNFYVFHNNLKDFNFQMRKGQRDVYAKLSELYSKVFEGRKMVGFNPSRSISFEEEPPFYFLDANNNFYELAEMSAGEKAIFPILLDFAYWQIHNSVVLIDEIELHLHPPLQQALLRALANEGSNNQFIITTHSDYVVSIFPESSIIRLD